MLSKLISCHSDQRMMSKLISCRSDRNTSLSLPSNGPQSQMLRVTPYLTEYLVSEILSRLPVKTLLQYRCVSKPWCSLIDSPGFAKTHLKRSIECQTNIGVIIRGCVSYSVDFDSLDNGTANAVEIDQPLKTLLSDTGVVGTCNGLHCLFNLVEADMFLWNPATRKCKKLPRAPTDFRRPFEFNWSSLSGFGYDAVNDDYKVLRILRPDDPFLSGSNTSKATVYSLKTNSWRRLQDISSHYQLNAAWGMFMGGALHWIMVKIMGSELCPSIIAFDLGSENYREFPLPHKNGKEMSLVTFAESLCILEFCLDIHVNVWVMNDYGVGNSWCKLFSVEQPKVSTSCVSLMPLAYSKSQKDVLIHVDTKKMLWYNLERDEVKTVEIANAPDVFDVEVFTESLIPPDYKFCCDGKQVQNQPQEEKKQQQQQKRNRRDNFLSKGFKLVL